MKIDFENNSLEFKNLREGAYRLRSLYFAEPDFNLLNSNKSYINVNPVSVPRVDLWSDPFVSVAKPDGTSKVYQLALDANGNFSFTPAAAK
ncbi:MAG: hypothetical protein EXS63_05680 [Candidatus Omnitrophica bacterium]|nr:hypothetical protein [Candidatus Omnitrophota bacterium]